MPDFLAGEILLFDKPVGWSSFQLVKWVRYRLKNQLDVKKLKVGHAGTLDPLASGLMILATGKKTKELQGLTGLSKAYTGTIVLGATRPSYDEETEIDQRYPVEHITSDLIEQTRLSFIGEQLQTPPVFSAKKVDGKRAYEHARKGEAITLKQNMINIHAFDITNITQDELSFYVECSKGTYIRSLAHDFGKALESGGYLKDLRRVSIGEFNVKDAWLMDDWEKSIE